MLYDSDLTYIAYSLEQTDPKKEPVYRVGVMPYYPAVLGKGVFDLFTPELAPPKQFRQEFERLTEKYLRIKDTMRIWGTTPEEKELGARMQAFVKAFGRDGIYIRRHIRITPKAQETINNLKHLAETRDLVFIDQYPGPAAPRIIIMHLVAGDRDVLTMFKRLNREAGYELYGPEYIRFGEYLSKRYTSPSWRKY